MTIKETLKDLTLLPALAGHEGRVARDLAARLRAHVDELDVDAAGNLIATLHGRDPRASTGMVFAHMDSLGFVVRRVEPDGFVRLERLGGVPEKVLPGLRLVIEGDDGRLVPGVVGVKAHHATPAEEKQRVTPYTELHVDLGCVSADEVRALGVDVGCPAVYQPEFTELQGERVAATAIDNRAGCAVLVDLVARAARQRPPGTLHFVATVQEEFNLRGAQVAAHRLDPDYALCLDLVLATDTHDLTERSELRLGAGPTMSLYSFHGRGTLNGTIPHPALVRAFRGVAARDGVALQRSANVGSLTDSAYVQLVRNGIPSLDLGYPVRYTHTPVETCDVRDLEALADLVDAGVRTIDADFDWDRYPGMETA